MMTTTRILRLSAALAVGVLIGLAAMSRVQPAAAAPCSLATIAAEIPLTLPIAAEAGAGPKATAFAQQYPTAVTISSATVRIQAPTVPAIDGQTATAIIFTDDTPVAAGGPPSQSVRLVHVACGVAFYSPASGDFIGALKIMADAPVIAQ